MRFSWSKFNRVVIYILIFLDKFVSLVALVNIQGLQKFLFKEQEFRWNEEIEFGLIFIFWILSISRFLQLMKFLGSSY